MEPFKVVEGAAAPLLKANIDTDVIIRIERLTGKDRHHPGQFALEALRYRPDGSEDPDFVLNQAAFSTAPILLAGPNFGCGSSREGAVHALMDRGIKVVIAPSFGDIFYSNCFQNGLLPVRLDEAAVERIARESVATRAPIRVDLIEQVIVAPSGDISFTIDPLRRAALLEGLDDIGQTLLLQDYIRAWQAEDRSRRPWVWEVSEAPARAPSQSAVT